MSQEESGREVDEEEGEHEEGFEFEEENEDRDEDDEDEEEPEEVEEQSKNPLLRKAKKKFESFVSSSRSAFDEYCKSMEEESAKAEEKYRELSVVRKKLQEELKLTRNELHDLSTSLVTLVEDWCVEKRRTCGRICAGQAPHTSRNRNYINVGRSSEGKKCFLCKKACTPSGDHTICSLSCGHFFGKACITQLIKNKTDGDRSSKCPKCSAKALLKDIRDHEISEMDDAR